MQRMNKLYVLLLLSYAIPHHSNSHPHSLLFIATRHSFSKDKGKTKNEIKVYLQIFTAKLQFVLKSHRQGWLYKVK